MITYRVIDITKAPVNAIAHQCNAFHTMGAGVARAIREAYPEAYEADLKTLRGSKAKLGTFSQALTKDGKRIFNVYSQYNLSQGVNDRATQYDMVDKGLRAVEEALAPNWGDGEIGESSKITLGIPFKYGCALGGGDWRVVKAIIESVFEKSFIDVLICEWPPPSHQEGTWCHATSIDGRICLI